ITYQTTDANTATDKTNGPVLLVDFTPCTGPTITCPANTSVQCYSSVPVADFTAGGGSTSGGCGTVTVAFVGDSATNGTSSCNNVITRTYRATDSNGNTANCTQTITVNDTTAPTIGSPGSNATIECPATPSFTAPTASDTCSGATVQDLGATTTAGTCANNYTSTKSWKAVDSCGNTSGTRTQTITVRDTTA